MAQPKTPPLPKEEYVKFERTEPSPEQQMLVLEMAVKAGLRPGTLGALIDHESAGTWHPWVRPSDPDKPKVKVTTDGKVRGETGSSAASIAQYTDATWLRSLYVHGEDIIRDAELAKYDPGAVTAIRKAREVMSRELQGGKAPSDWNTFKKLGDKLREDGAISGALALRTQTSSRIAIAVLANDVADYRQQLNEAGFEVNTTNLYILHHKDINLLRQLAKNADYVAAEDPRMQQAVAKNGRIFTNEDGSAKTGAETYTTYRNLVGDDHATRFERTYYGRDFGVTTEAERPVFLKAAGGGAYPVKRSAVMPPRLDSSQFVSEWKKPSVSAENPGALPSVIASLRKLGYDFGKTDPQDFANSRLRAALGSFKAQVGLPFAEKGELDTSTQHYLAQASANADRLIGLQQKQKAAVSEPDALNLRTLGKSMAKLAKDDPERIKAAQQVIELKERLAAEGLLKPPMKWDKAAKANVAQPFDAQVDNSMLAAYSAFQARRGLMDTKGVYDSVTRSLLPAVPAKTMKTSALDELMQQPASPAFNRLAYDNATISTAVLDAALGGADVGPSAGKTEFVAAPVRRGPVPQG